MLPIVLSCDESRSRRWDYASRRVSQGAENFFGKFSKRAQTVFEDVPRRLMGWVSGLSSGRFPPMVGKGRVRRLQPGCPTFRRRARRCRWRRTRKNRSRVGSARVTGHELADVRVASLYLAGPFTPREDFAAHANLAYGIIAFMLANIAAFSVATQAYADIFILLTLGSSFGSLFTCRCSPTRSKSIASSECPRAKIWNRRATDGQGYHR